jgi:hypothetical protein
MGRSKKIYEREHIVTDVNTGEIIGGSRSTVYVNTSAERFGMFTTTNGLGWAVKLKGVLLLLMYLVSISDPSTGMVRVTSEVRRELMLFLGLRSVRRLGMMLAECVAGNALRRVGGRNDFMINPDYFFSGSSKSKAEKLDAYDKLRAIV